MEFDQIVQTVTTIGIAFGLKMWRSWSLTWRVRCWRCVHIFTRITIGRFYFDTNRVIRESFGAAGFPVPEQHLAIRNQAGNGANAEQEKPESRGLCRTTMKITLG
jgi:hypothetical protein